MALQIPNRPLLELSKEKPAKKPTIRVRAAADDDSAPASDWGSLLGDLSRATHAPEQGEVEWRIHDRTHLEFAIDYPFEAKQGSYCWEAFFFVPESFRLLETTYDKKQIYDDLLSYVRLAVPQLPFEELANVCESNDESSLLVRLRQSITEASESSDGSTISRATVRRLRVFACMVRASGLDAQRAMLTGVEEAEGPEAASRIVSRLLMLSGRVSRGFRRLLVDTERLTLPSEVRVALRWVDEDLSLFLEAISATASVQIAQRSQEPDDGWAEIAGRLASDAVAEARYRKEHSYPSVGTDDASPREVEHIEFRRHVLKRFTSSVLWLRHEVRDGARWILQLLMALAAAVAMSFAVVATLYATHQQEYVYLYAILIVASYAVKDRMKAVLQNVFTDWAQKRFADRNWTIRDSERDETVGVVNERAGFRPFSKIPADVLAARRVTREHALEEFARPEAVLWHEKAVIVEPRKRGTLPSPMMTEIFRLNIDPWLAHTDDPNRTVTFADPDEAVVCSVTARRVYNINVVYRLRHADKLPAWKRIRVVVSRKGIERIDPIA